MSNLCSPPQRTSSKQANLSVSINVYRQYRAMDRVVALLALCASLANAHTVITYPGWRGNNLITNDSFPFGMQWSYPCEFQTSSHPTPHRRPETNDLLCLGGGLGVSKNRTQWPLNGGAIAVQPGWFAGHSTALFYINMGLGENPTNYSLPMVPVFHITGPSNNPYPGTFCLPKVSLPAGVSPKNGDLASIQVIEVAKHGASQYNVRVITPPKQSDGYS